MWFLARLYDAQQALDMGLVNTVVPLERLEEETLVWCVSVRFRRPCHRQVDARCLRESLADACPQMIITTALSFGAWPD